MDNNKTILIAVLLVVGLGAVYFSMKNNTKEGYAGGMPQRSARVEKLMVPVSKAMKAGMRGQPNFQGAKSVNFTDIPNVQARPQIQYPFQSSNAAYVQEGFDGTSSSLGSSANTNLPFVSQPNFQQTTPIVAPSVQYSTYERYQPTSLNNMGRSDAFSCAGNSGLPVSVEGFTDGVDSYPGPDYAAGNFNQASKQLQESQNVSAQLASTLDVLSPTGETQQVLVYDRPYTVNLKAGRFNRAPGTVDLIRGDLSVNVVDNRNGWFQSSGSPADLTVGSLSAIAGVNEADHVLKSMKKAYGSLSSNGYQAPKDFNYASMQFANMQSGLGDTTQITTTAFP